MWSCEELDGNAVILLGHVCHEAPTRRTELHMSPKMIRTAAKHPNITSSNTWQYVLHASLTTEFASITSITLKWNQVLGSRL